METALDDIAFLANSENRVAVLETVVENSRSRDELREEIDASRVTIARILREFEAREWIEQTGQEYDGTPLGCWMCTEFGNLMDEMEAEHRLRDALRWFPFELLTFDVRCLRDAEIILLDGSDSTALTRRVLEFHRSGNRIRGIARESAPVFIKNQWELTVHGETRVELVITPEIIESIRNHPPAARHFREMLDEDNAHYFVYEDIPLSVGIVNGAVGVNLIDQEGTLKGGVKTDDETVHEWAVDLFETYREKASPVEPDVISA
jgi:predicted transcriptional regulator